MATAKKSPKKSPAKKSTKKKGSANNGVESGIGEKGAPPIKAKPTVVGENLKSVVLRVDADFAMAIRAEAVKSRRNITSITRDIYRSMF